MFSISEIDQYCSKSCNCPIETITVIILGEKNYSYKRVAQPSLGVFLSSTNIGALKREDLIHIDQY